MTAVPPAEDVAGLYQRHAEAWDAARGRTLFEKPWLDRFLRLMPHGAAILDIGCGSGEPVARYLAGQGCRVTGIDSSETLVGLCRRRLPAHEWRVGDMRRLALGRRFDGLIAWDSFFHLAFDDQRAMFPVLAAHAAPGAALMFTSGPAHGEALGEFGGDTLYHASLAPGEYRALLASNGFDVVDFVAEDPGCGGHTIWLARRTA